MYVSKSTTKLSALSIAGGIISILRIRILTIYLKFEVNEKKQRNN